MKNIKMAASPSEIAVKYARRGTAAAPPPPEPPSSSPPAGGGGLSPWPASMISISSVTVPGIAISSYFALATSSGARCCGT